MALKSRKAAPAETTPELPNTTVTDETEPYMVFNTKEDYDNALREEMEKQSENPAPESKAQTAQADDDRERRIALWQRDAYMLKIIVPDFDFEAALKDERFRAALASGKTVFEAYAGIAKPAQSQRSEIFQNAQSESRGMGESELNPAKLSSEDFKKYIDRIRNN